MGTAGLCIIFGDQEEPLEDLKAETLPDALNKTTLAANDTVLANTLEIAVLKPDYTKLVRVTVGLQENVKIDINEQDNLKVHALLRNENKEITHFDIDHDVDMEKGKTSYVLLSKWQYGFVPRFLSEEPLQAVSGQSYNVCWTQVYHAAYYKVYLSTNPDLFSEDPIDSPAEFMIPDQQNEGTYYYKVKAVAPFFDASGDSVESAFSNMLTVIIGPPAPQEKPLLKDPENESVISGQIYVLHWERVAGATSYVIVEYEGNNVNDTTIIEVDTLDTEHNFVHAVDTTTTYHYYIRAKNANGSSANSNTVSQKVTLPLPDAPALNDPGISVYSGKSYTVSWESVERVDSYILLESTDLYFNTYSSESFLPTVTEKQISHTTISEVATYYYRVFASNESGEGGKSDIVGIDIIPIPLQQVQNLEAISDDCQISLHWDIPDDDRIKGVVVIRNAERLPADEKDGIEIYRNYGTVVIDTELDNCTAYYYSVFTFDELLNYSEPKYVVATPKDITPPNSVTNLSVSLINGGLHLSWDNPDDSDFRGTVIVRDTVKYPENEQEGVEVYRGLNNYCIDLLEMNGKTYYSAFSFDESLNYATADTISISQ